MNQKEHIEYLRNSPSFNKKMLRNSLVYSILMVTSLLFNQTKNTINTVREVNNFFNNQTNEIKRYKDSITSIYNQDKKSDKCYWMISPYKDTFCVPYDPHKAPMIKPSN
jgi:hypothetical protein